MRQVSEKKEKLLSFISALPAGTKVSVRNLARDLGVSEGTAYKAIKRAEELRLVETRSRAGTVRLPPETAQDTKPVTLASEIGRLGLSVLSGEEFADAPIGRVVVGDGSFDQFKSSAASAGANALCLVGDRPDLLFFAASNGMNIIVTNGTQPGEALLATATEHAACVLSSVQDSSILLNLLRSDMKLSYQVTDSDLADRWMRTPPYLYYNDVVADWYSSYRPIISLGAKCAVVDDELRICGNVDTAKALAAAPSTKISSLYSDDSYFLTADEATPMHEIAKQMISKDSSLAYVTHEGALSGVVTSNDVLRYYQFNPGAGGGEGQLPAIEAISSSPGRSVYTVQFGGAQQGTTDALLNVVNAAAKRFCTEKFSHECSFTSGTFFTLTALTPGEIMISCQVQQTLSTGFIFEVEMYNETGSFARCIMTAAVNGGEPEK